jgi:hypothetical protein
LQSADLEAWKKYGPLGLIHTLVIHIKRSPEKEQAFLEMSKGTHLDRDNKTRWNLYAKMIKIALIPQVRQAINRWSDERPHGQPTDEKIMEEGWKILEQVRCLPFITFQS